MEAWTTIWCLRAGSLSQRVIAPKLGICRNTVARRLTRDNLPKYLRKKRQTNPDTVSFEEPKKEMSPRRNT